MTNALAAHVAAAPSALPTPDRIAGWAGVAARLAEAPGVSIVIPIHNGSAQLERCLESVARHGDGAEIVLVDDRSTDPGVRALCEDLLARHDRAVLVVERQNVGYVRAVNSGLRAAASGHDVVLLNSDTVVTAGWLRKLRTAAYATADTACVCPLSNAAGVYSIPVAHEDSPLPADVDPDQANRILEDVSPRLYEATPAPSGFCLYVRRTALDAVGLFDEALMWRGYGEENDFCERLAQVGWRHAVDDATFVLHERAASFGAAKWALKDANTRLLKALHRAHADRQRQWEAASRLDAVRDAYATVLAQTGPADRGPVTTELAVATGADGCWSDGRRRIAVEFAGDRAEIDLFGIRRTDVAVPGEHRAGLVAWLANRWVAHRLDAASELADAGALETVAAAFGLERSDAAVAP